MTPEESDSRLRKIHEAWREWCRRNPLPKPAKVDEEKRGDAGCDPQE
jgi:hypothetical protein